VLFLTWMVHLKERALRHTREPTDYFFAVLLQDGLYFELLHHGFCQHFRCPLQFAEPHTNGSGSVHTQYPGTLS